MFEPRIPLVAAEEVVDFAGIDDHVLGQRRRVEAKAWPSARRLAHALHLHNGIPSARALDDLEHALLNAVSLTYRFGYDEATRELRELRRRRGDRPGLIGGHVPDHPYESTDFLRSVSIAAARAVSDALVKHYPKLEEDYERATKLEAYSRRMLHNAVLELVGRVLNAGRTLAAIGADAPTLIASLPPARYGMRSEQLDTGTCIPCNHEHGRVFEVGSPAYFEHLPPALCLGRGRCRGVMVYGDSPSDFLNVKAQLRLPAA